jgi:hypothetical protein
MLFIKWSFMSNLFILIYLGERGDEVNETWRGGGASYKSLGTSDLEYYNWHLHCLRTLNVRLEIYTFPSKWRTFHTHTKYGKMIVLNMC